MDLRTTQLKDTYGNLLTIGTTEGAPTSGTLENGQGADITSLTIAGTADATLKLDSNRNDIILVEGDTTDNNTLIRQQSSLLRFDTIADDLTTITRRITLDHSTGDISFRDGSNNEAFYWDADVARLGIGTNTPSGRLSLTAPTGNGIIDFVTGSLTSDSIRIAAGGSATNWLEYRGYLGHAWFVDATERMRIDSSGNQNVNYSNSAIHSYGSGAYGGKTVIKASNDNALSLLNSTTGGTAKVGINFTNEFTASQYNYLARIIAEPSQSWTTDASTRDSHLSFFTTLNGATAEKMRIDSSGNVGIGTDSPSEKLAVQSVFTTSASDVFLEINSGHQASGGSDVTGEAGVLFKQGGSGDVLRNAGAIISGREGNYSANSVADSYLAFETALNGTNTERMRIDSSGRLLSGTETALDGFSGTAQRACFSATGDTMTVEVGTGTGAYTGIHVLRQNSNGKVLSFERNSTDVGSISVTTTATAYNTSSDYRLKENVVELTGALDRVDQLKPSRFNFIADADTTVDGFLAHEVADIVPEAISGEKDAVDDEGNPIYQGIDQSKLVPLLVGAIQELRAEIEQLKAQL